MSFRLFVAGTDTGVGKTQAACALLSLLAERGDKPAPFKPYESGCADVRRPADALALRHAAGSDDPLEDICPHRFRLPLAPGVAAAREKRPASFEKTLSAYRRFHGRALIAEGAGGLLVPLDAQREVVDLIQVLDLPVLLVARAGLGTLNHTGLSLEALFRREIQVRAVLLVRSQKSKDAAEADNARVLHSRWGVPVLGPVPFAASFPTRARLFRKTLAPLL